VVGPTKKPVRIDTDQGGTLVFDGYGLMPEPYAYYVDGVRQDGVYIGVAGEIRWAWKQVSENGVVMWQPRLRVATVEYPNNGELKEGEVPGFLTVKGW
jgi:hypothetical protein